MWMYRQGKPWEKGEFDGHARGTLNGQVGRWKRAGGTVMDCDVREGKLAVREVNQTRVARRQGLGVV